MDFPFDRMQIFRKHKNILYLNHPENLIRKAIRTSKNFRIHPKLRSGGILGNFVFRSGQRNEEKNQEMIPSLQLLIRNEI